MPSLERSTRGAAGTAIVPRPHERSASGRMRIGYLSPDFRDHCQALFTIPLLSNHDRSAFEIFCYSHVERPDAITKSPAMPMYRAMRLLMTTRPAI